MSYRHLTSNIKVACSKLFKNVHFIFFHVVSIDKICYLHISLRTQLCISVCVFFLGGELTCDELLYHSGGVWLISWWWVLTSVKSIFYNDFVHVFVSYRIVKRCKSEFPLFTGREMLRRHKAMLNVCWWDIWARCRIPKAEKFIHW